MADFVSRVRMTFPEGDQTGPVAALLQPFDLSADKGLAGFDATMVGAGHAVAGQLGCMRWLVGKQLRGRTQGCLMALQRQDIIADSLWITPAAMPRWPLRASVVTTAPLNESLCRSVGAAVISFDFSSVA